MKRIKTKVTKNHVEKGPRRSWTKNVLPACQNLGKQTKDHMMNCYDPQHAKAALCHSIRRAYERYSIELSELDIFKISENVLNGMAILKEQNENRSTYKLNYLGRNFVLVFDFILMIVVTFLPHKVLKKLAQGQQLGNKFNSRGLYV